MYSIPIDGTTFEQDIVTTRDTQAQIAVCNTSIFASQFRTRVFLAFGHSMWDIRHRKFRLHWGLIAYYFFPASVPFQSYSWYRHHLCPSLGRECGNSQGASGALAINQFDVRQKTSTLGYLTPFHPTSSNPEAKLCSPSLLTTTTTYFWCNGAEGCWIVFSSACDMPGFLPVLIGECLVATVSCCTHSFFLLRRIIRIIL